MVVDNKNIYHQQLTSTIIYYFSTTKYNRPLLANCVLSPIFFKKRPKTETLLSRQAIYLVMLHISSKKLIN